MTVLADDLVVTDEQKQQIINYVDKNPVQFYWEYRDNLTPEQISRYLENDADSIHDIEEDIRANSLEYLQEQQVMVVRQALEQVEGLVDDLGEPVHPSDLNDQDIWDFMYNHSIYPGEVYNIDQLARHTWGYFGLQLKLEMPDDRFSRKEFPDYDDVKHILAFFNLNPRKVSYRYPDLPWRDGKESITAQNFNSVLANDMGGGTLVVLLNTRILRDIRKIDFSRPVTLTHARIVVHNFYLGSSAMDDFQTIRPITVHPDLIEGVYNDRPLTHGVQSVNAYHTDAWSTWIEQAEEPEVS